MTNSRDKQTFWVEIERDTETGQILSEAWKSADGKLHRTDRDQPAVRKFSEGSNVEEFNLWCCHGKIHRDNDKPAMIHRHPETGRIIQETWVEDDFIQRNNPEKPVSISYDEHTGEIIDEDFRVDGELVTITRKRTPS